MNTIVKSRGMMRKDSMRTMRMESSMISSRSRSQWVKIYYSRNSYWKEAKKQQINSTNMSFKA